MTDTAVDQSAASLLVFVHIPKTAGTTMRTVLGMNQPGESIRPLCNVFKGGGGLDRGWVKRLRDGDLPLDLSRARVVTGHFPLGICEYLPNYLAKEREVRSFTFLREPVDRSLSHYYRIRERREGSSRQPKYARSPLPSEPTLDDTLEAGFMHDNLQTRMLSGLPEPFGEVTEEMLERAKQNLSDGLFFFGLTERFDESLVLAKQRMGFRSILYRFGSDGASRRSLSPASGRVNPSRPRGDQIPRDLVEAAEACNRYDIELYRHAQDLFDSAPERGQVEFEIELAALHAAHSEGGIEVDEPAPNGFGGDDETWRMLLHARASLLRRELELARTTRNLEGSTPDVEPYAAEVAAAGIDASSPKPTSERTGSTNRKAGRSKSRAPGKATSQQKGARTKKARRRQSSTSEARPGAKRRKRRQRREESRSGSR
jgi:hypothetical protein